MKRILVKPVILFRSIKYKFLKFIFSKKVPRLKITQANQENISGFKKIEGTDYGCDEEGNIALGYQHHDALWWDGPTAIHTKRPPTLELAATVSNFDILFGRLAWNVVKRYKPSTVLDLGCGNGLLASKFRDFGVLTVTVDANSDVFKSPFIDKNHFLARTDKELEFKYDNGQKVLFDLVISLEHFEHIPEETFDRVMQNICTHTRKGSFFIFTAAQWEYEIEDQKHVHCNIKNENEWRQYVSSYGFEIMKSPFKLNRAGDTAEVFCRKVYD